MQSSRKFRVAARFVGMERISIGTTSTQVTLTYYTSNINNRGEFPFKIYDSVKILPEYLRKYIDTKFPDHLSDTGKIVSVAVGNGPKQCTDIVIRCESVNVLNSIEANKINVFLQKVVESEGDVSSLTDNFKKLNLHPKTVRYQDGFQYESEEDDINGNTDRYLGYCFNVDRNQDQNNRYSENAIFKEEQNDRYPREDREAGDERESGEEFIEEEFYGDEPVYHEHIHEHHHHHYHHDHDASEADDDNDENVSDEDRYYSENG